MAASRKQLNIFLAMQYWQLPVWEAAPSNDKQHVDLFPLGGTPAFRESSTCIFEPRGWATPSKCYYAGCGDYIDPQDRTLHSYCVKHFWACYAVQWKRENEA